MQPFRLFGGARRAAAHPTPVDDIATVRDYTHDITQACIDLIDLPFNHEAQQRVIELLLHRAPAAEQAMARLEDQVPAHL